MSLRGKYAAHELLFENDQAYTCDAAELHGNEVPGRDIRLGPDGVWHDFEDSEGMTIDAAPIAHRGM
jgi:ribonuclease Z